MVPRNRSEVGVTQKVVFVGPRLQTGGISKFVKDLDGAEIGYRIHPFNTGRPPKPATRKAAFGYRTLFDAGIFWAIRNGLITGWHIVTFPVVILASRAALVHVATSSDWTFWESAIYLCCAKLVGRKTILHFLSDFQRFYGSAGSFEKQMIQRTFQFADIVFVLSENVRRTVSTFMPEDRVVTVPSSVDVDSFIDTKAPRETGSEEKIRVLFMGGTSGARKGVSDLGSAIPEVLARCPNVEFILCGTVDVQMAYRRLGTGYQESVRYLGFVDSTTKSHLLSTADVYALPSYSEGMPYGIIEAMAAGLAIVATSVGSIPEIVVDGENGLLIRPGDIDCLAQSLVRLAACPQLLHGMATVNREKVSKFYSKAVAFDLVRKNYDRVLAYHD